MRPRSAVERAEDRRTTAATEELILDLLLREEFPRVHRPSLESREVLRLLRYRHRLVQMRTRCKNSLQALAGERRLGEASDAAQSKGAGALPATADERRDGPAANRVAFVRGSIRRPY